VIARRLLSLLALLALLATPFGHMKASAHGTAHVAAGPCHGHPSAPGKADRTAIDCAIACAAIAPIGPAPAPHIVPPAAGPEPATLAASPGIRPTKDPPPPRLG